MRRADTKEDFDNRASVLYNAISKNINIEYILKGNDVKEKSYKKL